MRDSVDEVMTDLMPLIFNGVMEHEGTDKARRYIQLATLFTQVCDHYDAVASSHLGRMCTYNQPSHP
jgi:hypothetical protein